MRKFFIAAILLLAGATALRAEKLIAYRDSVKNGYNFLLYLPDSYSPVGKPLPLVVCLHGGSLAGTNLPGVARYGCIDALRRGVDIDAIVLCPQSPTSQGWEAEKVMNVIDWVGERYPYNTDRLYVMGLSMGGWGTFKMVAKYPDRIAAAMAMCGGFRGDVEPMTEVPLWILHGTNDDVCNFSNSSNIVKDMYATGKADRLIFTPLPGADHSILVRIYLLEQTYKWLFSHTLQDPDRYVRNEYEIDMDDIHKAYTRLNPAKARILPITKP